MTVLMTRTDTPPTVIDGVYVDARDVPARNPHRVSTRATAVLVLGTAAAFLTNLDGGAAGKTVNVACLLAAIAMFVTCLIRFNVRADAGDR